MNEEELKKLQSTVEFDFKKAVTIYGPNIIQEEKLTSCYDTRPGTSTSSDSSSSRSSGFFSTGGSHSSSSSSSGSS